LADSDTKSWETIRRQRPLDEARVLAYQRLMQADVALEGLRRRRGLIRMTLADTVDADELEREADLYFATLARYVAALGGQLKVEAVFPEGAITVLTLPDEQTG
jgi:hypothetical protein